MRGDLDETLARLARREEALRRRAGGPDEEAAGEEPTAAGSPRDEHGAYRLRGASRPGTGTRWRRWPRRSAGWSPSIPA